MFPQRDWREIKTAINTASCASGLDPFYDVSWVINSLLLVYVNAVHFNAVRLLCGALIST